MKRLLILLVLIAPVFAFGQFKVDPDTKSMYSNRPAYMIDMVAESHLKKKDIYSNALGFIAAAFPDSRDVIQVKDLELGEIMFNGTISKDYIEKSNKTTNQPRTLAGTLHFKCKLYLKDNRFKIVLYALEVSDSLFPTYNYTLDVPVLSGSKEEDQPNVVGRELAASLIADVISSLNKKPASDF